MKSKAGIVILQVFLLVSFSFAIAYFLDESSGEPRVVANEKKGLLDNVKVVYKTIVEAVLGGGLVSAEELVSTCVRDKQGALCQEYLAAECDSLCSGTCIPTSREETSECKLGTCYDSVEGTCQERSSAECSFDGDVWIDDPLGNDPLCQTGCCLYGYETTMKTERACQLIGENRGQKVEFNPNLDSISCWALARVREEAACVFPGGDKSDCRFVTEGECEQIGGDFRSGFLCSAEELNTDCEKQTTTSCVEGKDEVYWFDSCGNRENIYWNIRDKSWNDGKILSKDESCSLGNNLGNQDSCGNCNYLTGSRCGLNSGNENADFGEFVCKDLRCEDSDGDTRENGESWCAYQGAIGLDDSVSGGRSVDTPGSRHFRETCIDGEVQTEGCADYRNEICVESQDEGLSFAACRLNRWQQCIEYNTRSGSEGECEQNPDCFVKKINIADNFRFDVCAPKYPAGFNLRTNGEGAETICSLASQKCTVIWVKKVSGWKCVANCDCRKAGFAQQMNDMCMSLGDCGASVNYQGELSESYKVYESPGLSGGYLNKIEDYADYSNSPNDYASPGDLGDFYGTLGIPSGLGSAEDPDDATESLGTIGMVGGLGGVALMWAAGTTTGATFLAKVGLAQFTVAGKIPIGFGSGLSVSGTGATPIAAVESTISQGAIPTGAPNPGLNAAGGALAGAAIGFSVTSMLIQYTGIGKGLSKVSAYGLLAAGTVAGAMIGYGIFAGGGKIAAACAVPGACILAIAVIITVIIMKLMGVGKTKKRIVSFECQPWKAAYGGDDCDKCGSDGFPCSRYACQSLGQTCEFINEGTGQELCVHIAPDDPNPPRIGPGDLTEGFSWEEESDVGVKIKSSESDGCVKGNVPLTFGIELSKPAECRFDIEHTGSYEEMQYSFGGRSLSLYNHTQIFNVPNVPGFDPDERSEANLYVRCKDVMGIENSREYVINFCIRPGVDLSAPVITNREPVTEYAAWVATELNASVYTNEPSECKWDSDDKDYDSMDNEFECANDVIGDQTAFGWKCNDVLPVGDDDSVVYVRCKDQPWQEDDSKRNVNTESYEFVIKKSNGALNIDSISPENGAEIEFGVQPATVEILVETSGGVDGTATCNYKVGSQWVQFLETWEKTHKQVFNQFTEGDKKIEVRCEDDAGNVAFGESEFEVIIDVDSPRVTRVYEQSGDLVVVTDEDAECRYTNGVTRNRRACNFVFENATRMNGDELVHTTSFDDDLYYVKCKDEFGNGPGSQCSIVVRNG